MAEADVENGLEFLGWATKSHYDKTYDKVVGKPPTAADKEKSNDGRSQKSGRNNRHSRSSSSGSSDSSSDGGRHRTRDRPSRDTASTALQISGQRRRQRNQLPSPEPPPDRGYKLESERSLRQESQTSDSVLREYEREPDDPKRKPESVLSKRDFLLLEESRRDSAMAYNDNHQPRGGYADDRSRPRSQPPRDKYYDDDDSDYDERSGQRQRGGGRGYGDRDRDDDYQTVYEETTRYRGPVADRSNWDVDRRESNRDGPYASGAVAKYNRRSGSHLERPDSRDSRGPKSRGRDRSRSRSDSRSRSRSRSREGVLGKIEDSFSTSRVGLGAGLAGAVIGGLAGREFGHKHQQRDIIIGAIVGGLGANAAATKWTEYQEEKQQQQQNGRGEMRYEGRSRSNNR